MGRAGQSAGRVLLALLFFAPTLGCFGVTQNPSYFPFYLPTGDIIRTHAKPPGFGYFSNFDPHAVRLEVTPIESSGPTKTQLLLIASVSDENGQPRRHRRVEWMLEGAGNIVEVDESGYFAGRGYKVDNRYAVSFADYLTHTLKTGDGREVTICPGQTWCLITSAVEGETHVTVYAPEIASWERHKVFVTRHWCDAEWRFPPATVSPAGAQPVLTTQLLRTSDRQPLPNYRVRYRVIDGPPVRLLPGQTQEAEVGSDANGEAKVTLAGLQARPGNNRIAIEVIRPEPGGPGLVVGRGETTLEWQAPQVALSISAPPTAVAGQELPITFNVTNPSQVATQALQVRAPLPQGMTFVASDPPARLEGNQLVWQLTALPGGGNGAVRANFRVPSAGVVTMTAQTLTADGLRAEAQATTRVAIAQLQVAITGATTTTPNEPVTLDVAVTNPGSGPATGVKLRAEFDPTLEHESRANPLEVNVGTLQAGETQRVPLTLMPRGPGRPTVRAIATADGNLRQEAVQTLAISQRTLALSLTGPSTSYLNRPATWDVRLVNAGDVALDGVQLRVPLPPEVSFRAATGGGQLTQGQVVWPVSSLRPGQRLDLQLTLVPVQPTTRATLVGIAAADMVNEQRAEAVFDVLGMAALRIEVTPPSAPVEVGGKAIYAIRVVNQGTLAARQVVVKAVFANATPRFGTGPTVGQVQADQVTFAPLAQIEAGQAVVFRIEAEPKQLGDARLRVELRSDTSPTPIVSEEVTPVLMPNRSR